MREKFISFICAISLLLNSVFPVLSASVVYADEATESATVAPEVTPSPTPESSPESTPAITPSPTPEVSPAPSESPMPTTQPESTPSPSPTENIGQPNAPPDESPSPSPSPSPTSEPSPSVVVEQIAKGHISAVILENTNAQTLQLDLTTQGDVSSASLSTDKADYAPTDTAVIAGSDFPKETQLKLIITADNYRFEAEIKTDENGSFIYSYQLDGTYRPLYNVGAQDLSGLVLATTTFTDSPPSGCTNDSGGLNDLPGANQQKDLTKMCADYINLPVSVDVTWNWDNSSFTGGNTGDACALFDTDSDGKANYAVCVQVGGDPGAYITKFVYSCDDSSATNCLGNATISPVVTTCTANVQETDPFLGGAGYPNDTVASCTINLSDVGGSLATLTDVCSYPSASTPSNASDCILFRAHAGKLTLTKVLSPNTDPGLFNLQIDGVTATGGADVGDGGTTLTADASEGSHTIGETAGTNTLLSNYTSSVVCKDGHGTGNTVSTSGTNPWTLSVADGTDVLCTITNTRVNNASITIVKDTQPNDAQDFAFTTTGSGLSNFSLDDDSDSTLSNTKVFSGLAAGTYSVIEEAVTNWTQTSATCNDGSPVTAIDLAAGESVTCTFTNTRDTGTLRVIKDVVSDNGGTKLASDFTMHVKQGSTDVTGSPAAGSATGTVYTLNTGSYTISENTPPTGYIQTGFSGDCDSSGNVTVVVGAEKTCTITNDDVQPKLTVTKVVVNDNGGTKEVSDFPLFVDTTSVVSGVQNGFNAGTYTVSETNPGGYTGIITGDCAANGSITLSVGGVKSCTITNDDQAGTLIVKKIVSNNNGGTKLASDFSFQVNGGSVTAFESDAQNNLSVSAGTYNVTEPAVTGYSTSYDNCSNLEIANGGSATCTITNDDIAPSLTLLKTVTTDNGGAAVNTDWTLTATGTGGSPTNLSGTTPVSSETGFKADSYTLGENSGPSGYTASQYSCVKNGGDAVLGNTITLGLSDTATCTINNNDVAPTLKLVKSVTNNNGGTATASAWILTATGEEGFSDAGNSTTFHTVKAGVGYVLSESSVPGYTAGGWSCSGGSLVGSTITLGLNQNVTCTITNDDQAAHLIIIKQVTNDNGGTKVAGNFSGTITGVTAQGGQSWTGTVSPGVDKTLTSVGSYNVSETADSSYDTTYSADCTGTIALGETKTCTVTNNDKVPSLTLNKIVVNDNGGTKVANDWSLYASSGNVGIGGTGPTVSSDSTFSAGTYTLSETGPSGYTPSAWICVGGTQEGNTITLGLGESATCTITNDDIAPQLTVIKHVITDDGGVAVAGDFTMNVTGTSVLPSASFAGSESGTTVTLDQGSYSVDENAFAGYAKAIGDNCSGTINVGESKTCTITNNDTAGTLIVKKVVINDNGGALNEEDFSFQVGTGSAVPFEADGQNDLTVDAGTYTVTEPAVEGYNTTYDNCTRIVIPNGGTQTCTITNNDQPAHLKVIKHVVNDNGGSASSSDFTMTINGVVVQGGSSSFSGEDAPGTDSIIEPGTYNVTEEGPSGYSGSFSTDCSGTIALGQTKTCTVTNDDQAATLIVKKIVINDNGGTKLSQEFSFEVNDGSATAFEADGQNDLTVDAGTYSVTEPQVSGYDTSYDNCSSVVIPNGGSATCTITNDDIQPKLTITKVVVNDNGGSARVSDFPLFVNSTQVTSGVQNGFNAGSYTVSETSQSGYSATISGDCTSNGNITLALGDVKSCTITNNDQSGTLIVRKIVVNDNGGTLRENDFSFSVNEASAEAFESDGQNDLTVDAGTYNITEPEVTGYDTSYDNCVDVNIPNGGSATCTITNDDIAPTLTLVKTVTNDNGGLATQDDFNVYINGQSSSWGEHTLEAGSYTVSEATASGYTPSDWGTDCAANGTIILNIGDEKTCSITNDDEPGKISGKKFNDLDGDHVYTNTTTDPNLPGWTITLDKQNDSNPPVCITPVGELCVTTTNSFGNYAFNGLEPGTYIVAEVQQVPAWIQTRPNATYGGQGAQADGTYILTIGSGTEIDDRDFGNQGRGTIKINKIVSPSDTTEWDFRVIGERDYDLIRHLGDGGSTTLTDVPAANYTITETTDSNYTTTIDCGDNGSVTNNAIDFAVAPGEDVECTFTNTRNVGSLQVNKELDSDGEWDGEFDNDEANDLGFRWGIDSETPEHLMGDTASPLPTGTYSVSENDIAGYTFTGWYDNNSDFGSCDEPEEETLPESINVSTDNQSSITLCNVRDTGRIIIQKLIDEDGDLQTTDDRTPGVDWVMDVDGTGQDTSDPSLSPTDDNGETQTDNIKTGEYTAVEGSKEGYHIVTASCSAGEESSRGTFDGTDSVDGIQVGKDETVNCTFINTQNDGTIIILKNIDNNGDGDSDDEEDVRNAQGWTYDIAEGDQDNPMGGEKSLVSGSYTISEDEQEGYKLLGWSCSNKQNGTTNSIEISVRNGSQTTCTFTNQILPPVLNITKINDKTGVDVSAGANVLYTLTLTLTGSSLSDVTLIDLPPAGFKYRSGSWTASSNINPALAVTEPTYASPGTWSIGSMQTGEIITLTYIADIETSADPGLYKDLAWAQGSASSGQVLALAQPQGFVDTNFVGTEVNVVKDTSSSTGVNVENIIEKQGEVLGASIALPNTGAKTIWVVLAGGLMVLGFASLAFGIMVRRRND